MPKTLSEEINTDHVEFELNEARIDFVNKAHSNLYVWTQYKECHNCLYNDVPLSIKLNNIQSKLIKSDYSLKYAVTNTKNQNDSKICEAIIDAQEQSIHRVIIANDSCHTEIFQDGRNEFYMLFIAIVAIILFAGAFYLLRFLWRIYKSNYNEDHIFEARLSARQNCLDAFRGMTILLMIFCNWGSGQFSILDHAEWNGLHFADFIFPCFIFIMGVTMAISLRSMIIKKDMPLGHVYLNIIRRSLKLFLVGIILGSKDNPDIRELRIPGVLQRFAISYLIVAIVHVYSVQLSRKSNKSQFDYLSDIIPFWPDWILALVMLIIYFVMTFAWKFDQNCPAGYVGPGGMESSAKYAHCTGGAAAKLDELVFTKNHIYKQFTAQQLYDPEEKYDLSHDPEGLLGCTTSIVLTIIGLQVGKIILAYESARDRIIRMLTWILLLGLLGMIFSITGVIPINKNLWSFTFICVTGAVAILIFCIFYILIDHYKWWPRGTPFHYPGMNSILLYIGHNFTESLIPFAFITKSSSHFWFLFQNITGVLFWHLISVYLAKRKFFFTL